MFSILFIPFFVAICFCAYVFFDCLTLLVRAAGSYQRQNAAGGAFEKIMSTFKRIALFTYPPVLGFIILRKQVFCLLLTILFSYFCGFLTTVFCASFRAHLLNYCDKVITNFSKGQNALTALLSAFFFSSNKKVSFQNLPCLRVVLVHAVFHNCGLFFTTLWVVLFYSSSLFLVNVFAMKFSGSAVVILQTIGLINGIGTLLLAFVVDPMIARRLDQTHRLEELVLCVFASQVFVYSLLGPAFFVFLFFLLFKTF